MSAPDTPPRFVVRLNDEVVADTTYRWTAEAAWIRASTWNPAKGRSADRVTLTVDGECIADVGTSPSGRAWPHESGVPATGVAEAFRAITRLLHDNGLNDSELAQAMTAYGLPTNRARIKAASRGDGSLAELVVLINAVQHWRRERERRA